MIKCNDCRHYKPKYAGYSMGRCLFPLPEWLMVGASGGGFVHEYHEKDCATFAGYEQNKNASIKQKEEK